MTMISAKTPQKATKKRGKCDCEAPLETWAEIASDGRMTEKAVRCNRCQAWMKRVVAFDVTSLVDCRDPRPKKFVVIKSVAREL